MDAEFWHERWHRNEIGFHQPEGNASLRSGWPQVPAPAAARVLVPLCGKSEDMAWLAGQGCRVVGVELSGAAVRAFIEAHGLEAGPADSAPGLEGLRAGGYEFHVGDFFALDADDLGAVDAVYDRAALIALPAGMRRRYAAKLLALAGRAPILLITLEYPPKDMQGPPFSVPEAEVRSLFGGDRQVAALGERDVLGAESGLRARGVTRLFERSWLLTARD